MTAWQRKFARWPNAQSGVWQHKCRFWRMAIFRRSFYLSALKAVWSITLCGDVVILFLIGYLLCKGRPPGLIKIVARINTGIVNTDINRTIFSNSSQIVLASSIRNSPT